MLQFVPAEWEAQPHQHRTILLYVKVYKLWHMAVVEKIFLPMFLAELQSDSNGTTFLHPTYKC